MENATVQMIRHDLRDLPDASLPAGFRLRAFQPGDQAVWTEIIRESERFFEVVDDLFDSQFGHDLPSVPERVFFLEEIASGRAVGTTAAWYGDNSGGLRAGWGRIHWVAVRPDAQGKGLGGVLLAHALEQLSDLGHSRAYLVTSTGRHAALRLYLRSGFLPDLSQEGALDAWQTAAAALPDLLGPHLPGKIPV